MSTAKVPTGTTAGYFELDGEPVTSETDMVTVCDACMQASCAQGIFFCVEYQSAGMKEVSVAELRGLKLEHPDYWRKA